MNPLLKHPIVQFVGYEMMKRPTLEGIKANLKKESEKGKWGRILLPLIWIFISIPHLFDGRTIFGIIGMLLGICGFFILRWENKRNINRLKILDEDILERIEIHKEWSNNKFQ